MRRRQGFTLVELLVAMALIIFIMAILSQAFGSAMTTFRNLKALGDMAEKLRATTQILQRDLGAYHFEGTKRLSDSNFWNNGPPQQGFFQIYQGSPSYWQGIPSPPLTPPSPMPTPPNPLRNDPEAQPGSGDLSLINSYRSTDHYLSFTVKLRGTTLNDFLTAGPQGTGIAWPQPPAASQGTLIGVASNSFGPPESRYQPLVQPFNTYNYQWAAVAWFLQPQINPTTGAQDMTVADPTTGSPAVPLWTLYRRQALLVPDNGLVPTQSYPNQATYNTWITSLQEMSCWGNPISNPPGNVPGSLYFNSPIDITDPLRRYWGGASAYTPIAGALTGADIQLNDVVSFDVRLLVQGVTNPVNSNDPFVTLWQWPFDTSNTAPTNPGINNGNSNYYPTNPNGPMVFDTWTSINDGLTSNYTNWNSGNLTTSIPLWNPNVSPPIGPTIQAIQVTIRIWDYRTNQTRQVTIVQAM